MAQENQIMKEPQQVQQEPQRVTTKDPKKVEVGKRLAAINHKNREAKKREKGSEWWNEPILWNWLYSSCGSDRWPWLLHLSN